MSRMTYRGVEAEVAISEEDGCLVGRIVGTSDIVGFHGDTVPEVRAAFEEAVDDWLDWRGERSEAPERGFVYFVERKQDGWRWRLLHVGGEAIAQSARAYASAMEARDAVEAVRAVLSQGEVREVA